MLVYNTFGFETRKVSKTSYIFNASYTWGFRIELYSSRIGQLKSFDEDGIKTPA